MAFLAESDEEAQAGGTALTPRVAVVKRFRRDGDLTSPDTLSSSDSPSSFVLVESPHRDTGSQAAQAQSRPVACSLLRATPKTRPRTGPLPSPTFPLRGRLDAPPAFGGLPAPCFCPPQTDRFPFTMGPTGTATARVPIPAWEGQPASLRYAFRDAATGAASKSVSFAGIADPSTGLNEIAGRHAIPVSASPGALAEGATYVAAAFTQSA